MEQKSGRNASGNVPKLLKKKNQIKTDRALAELVRISNLTGADSSLVLGAFGNTSAKTADGRYMYIKASGTALKDMTCEVGWRRLKVDSVMAILKDKSLAGTNAAERQSRVTEALLSACEDNIRRRFSISNQQSPIANRQSSIKPSIEACFHSILDRYVIHLHPAAVLAYACARNGRAELEKLFRNEKLPIVWVPYADIGYMLARKIQKLTRNYKSRYNRAPAIMFLQNHGLLVTASSSNTALRLVRRAVGICRSKLKRPGPVKIKTPDDKAIAKAASAIRAGLFGATGTRLPVAHRLDENIAGFMERKDAAQLCSAPAVTPDELVYARGPAMWLDKPDGKTIANKLNRQIANKKEIPAAFLIRPLGLFVAAPKNQLPLIKDVVSTYLSVRSFAAGLGGIKPLNKRQREFITDLKARED